MERPTFISFGKPETQSLDYLIRILQDARITTLQRVQDISLEELHWQFDKGWNTVGVLLAHIIACEHYFRITFVEERALTSKEEAELLPGLEMGKFIPELINENQVDHYVSELANSRALLLEKLSCLSVEDFQKKREGYNPKTGHNLAWTLYHLAEDEIHHRGQISIIRKLYRMDVNSEIVK